MTSKENILIYYPYSLRKELNTGSLIRMNKMLTYFEKFCHKNNYNLIKIMGEQKERKRKFKEVKSIDPASILYCYIELPNIPLILSNKSHIPTNPFLDIEVFKYLKKNGIPIGAFYRDIYWKFDDMYPLKGLKKNIMHFLHKRDLAVFKEYFDVFFLPSIEMNKYSCFPADKVIQLPSGGEERNIDFELLLNKEPMKSKEAIYVGALHPTAGVSLLLKGISTVNSLSSDKQLNLTLICRQNEFENYKETFSSYLKEPWLKIKHLSSEELKKYYLAADFAIIPRQQNTYNNFAMPVKLIEYISYGMPILSTNCTEVADFIKTYNYGVVAEDSLDSFVSGINKIVDMIDNNQLMKEVIYNDFLLNHTWMKRVEKIDAVLSRLK